MLDVFFLQKQFILNSKDILITLVVAAVLVFIIMFIMQSRKNSSKHISNFITNDPRPKNPRPISQKK